MPNSFFKEKEDFSKYLSESINFVNSFDEEIFLSFSSNGNFFENIPLQLIEGERDFEIRFNHYTADFEMLNPKLKNQKGEEVLCKAIDIYKRYFSSTKGATLTAKISKVVSSEFDEENDFFYIRLMIPVSENTSFAYNISADYSVKTEDKYYFDSLIDLKIDKNNFHFFIFKIFDQNYLIIESIEKITYKDFFSISKSIIMSFAFITGKFYFNKGYFTLSQDKEFKSQNIFLFKSLFAKITNVFPIIDTSNINGQNNEVSIELFNIFVNKVVSDKNFSRGIFIFLNASNIKEMFMSCSLYSVALETLCGLIHKEDPILKYKFLNNDSLWIEFRDKLLLVYDEYKIKIKNHLKANNKNFIKSKIDNMNQSGSTESLKLPFEKFGIPLNKEENKVIKFRNDFLHGDHPFLNEDDSSEWKILYVALRFHMLFVKLTLKYLGYSGSIMNYVKIHEIKHKVSVNEEENISL